MAETVREKTKCSSCGVVVRDGAVFCYSCGESIKSKKMPESPSHDRPATNNGHTDEPRALKVAENQTDTDKPQIKESRPGLRSAASMRGKVKAYNRKPVEVEWAEPERPPVAYIIVSILLVVFTALMLFLAWYLK